MSHKTLQNTDGDDDVVFEEDEEEDEGYLFAGQGISIKKCLLKITFDKLIIICFYLLY